MNETASKWCVLLPCSNAEKWAVPQNCLAEIVTLAADTQEPPDELEWRGQSVPILDFGETQESPWADQRAGAGLVAVMLGLKSGAWEYCGVALRGQGLAMKDLARESIEDAPDMALEGSVSAFRMGGEIYQVPKLQELHSRTHAIHASA